MKRIKKLYRMLFESLKRMRIMKEVIGKTRKTQAFFAAQNYC